MFEVKALFRPERFPVGAFRTEHGGGNSRTMVERRDRRVGTHKKFRSGFVQCVECVRNPGRIAPESSDDVAVIHGMLRLDARGETKLRQPRDIALLKHLGVLDGTMGMSTLCAVEYDGVRLIPMAWQAMSKPCSVANRM